MVWYELFWKAIQQSQFETLAPLLRWKYGMKVMYICTCSWLFFDLSVFIAAVFTVKRYFLGLYLFVENLQRVIFCLKRVVVWTVARIVTIVMQNCAHFVKTRLTNTRNVSPCHRDLMVVKWNEVRELCRHVGGSSAIDPPPS